MINFLWDIHQEAGIRTAKIDASIADHRARNAKQSIRELEQRFERLNLISQAMWALIQEKTDLKDKDLLEMVTEIDLKDGKLDGKYTKPLVRCPKCDAAISHKFNRCLFCGEAAIERDSFSTV